MCVEQGEIIPIINQQLLVNFPTNFLYINGYKLKNVVFGKMLKKSLLLVFTISQFCAYSQYNVDSLFKNSERFRKVWTATNDTFKLFNSNEVFNITLETDIKSLRRKKYKDEYQPAVFKILYNDTLEITRDIKIKARGNFRKKHCTHPPIKLNFKKGDFLIKSLQDIDKMKMVVVCKSPSMYHEYLINEYLVYKIYNLITDNSFRVRLLKVDYNDSNKKLKSYSEYAFLIEDTDLLVKRLDAIELKGVQINANSAETKSTTIQDVFQYMIGNTDWSIPALHNMKLIKLNDHLKPKPIVIPYDFDYSGLVNTEYAIPNDNLPISEVTERLYRGFCRTPEEMQNAFKVFRENKGEILALYENSNFLSKNYKAESLKYLNDFFNIIENPRNALKDISNTCRKD